ncbi:hypothetical protein [Sphingomonas trueperi]|uniref:hypothetical protein n=1 Tax=Sphingomonas trueperi TaxID=53317 RepID=UPI000F1A9AAB
MKKPTTLTVPAAYANLMEEIKQRLIVIEAAVNGATSLPPIFVEDFCFLQLRFIGETIGIACLLAHGDIPAPEITSKLKQTWDTDRIIKTLSNVHPDFFPIPVKVETRWTDEHPEGEVHLHEAPPGNLTKDELLGFLGKVGNRLHRGGLMDLEGDRAINRTADYSPIYDWYNKVAKLLNEHQIRLLGGEVTMYLCILAAPPNGQVVVAAGGRAPEE